MGIRESTEPRGYSAVALHSPINDFNIGAVLRAVKVFGASLLAIDGRGYNYAPTDVFHTYKSTPMLHVENVLDALPYDCVPVAVDLVENARPLHKYTHPERAFYIFGPENGTLGKKILDKCRDIVYVDTPGPCMNLSAAVNVVLYDRLAKQKR